MTDATSSAGLTTAPTRPGAHARTPLSGDEIVAADLPDWRLVGKRLRTRYTLPSYPAGLDLVARIGAAAEAADHHPALDLRYGWLGVSLHSHDVHAITSRDIDLARQISGLAAELGAQAHPQRLRHLEIALDTGDYRRISPFWKALLGFGDHPDLQLPQDLADPDDELPGFWFQTSAHRDQRDRMHLDLHVPHDEARARVAVALSAGGRLVTDEFAPSWWVLADADGNEVCVCTWQDRRG